MRRSNQTFKAFLIFISAAATFVQSVQASGFGFQFGVGNHHPSEITRFSNQEKGFTPKKIAGIALTSFIIGNIVSWSMGAWPRDFEEIPYTPSELETISELQTEIAEEPEEGSLRAELGSIYFRHNELDKAETELTEAVRLEPDNAESKAWFYANEVKQSGAMFDPLMGIRKLNRLNTGIDELNSAVDADPDNAIIRLIRLETIASVGTVSSSFSVYQEDEDWFQSKLEHNANYFPKNLAQSFYLSLAKAYHAQEDTTRSKYYLEKIETLNALTTQQKETYTAIRDAQQID